MPTTITSAGITFNDATTLTSANGVPSALKLTTARTINGILFDGTANITIPATGASTAKAWVNFNGSTGIANSSYNVSSVTLTSTGTYTISFSPSVTNPNLVCVASVVGSTSSNISWQFTSFTTSSVALTTYLGTNPQSYNAPIQVVIFGV